MKVNVPKDANDFLWRCAVIFLGGALLGANVVLLVWRMSITP